MSGKKKSAILDEEHNVVQLSVLGLFGEYKRLHDIAESHGLTLVQFFKSRLGPQNFCLTTHRRFWIWHDEAPTWLIYVHPDRGIQFCVFKPCVEQEEKNRWGELMHKVLMPDEWRRVRGKR